MSDSCELGRSNVGDHQHFLNDSSQKKKNSLFSCHVCSTVFKHNGSLYNHLKSVHHMKNIGNKTVKCVEKECECVYFKTVQDLRTHLENVHGKNFETVDLSFSSMEEFESWKQKMEKESKASYATFMNKHKTEGQSIKYYKCGRSGKYRDRSNSPRERRIKTQGSNKSGVHCTSTITVTFNEIDGKPVVLVKFIRTHYGHEIELAHIKLLTADREKIAAQLVQGVSKDTVLDKVRQSVTGNELDRIHLLTRKDIANVEKSFNVNMYVQRHKNDVLGVDAWVKEQQVTGKNDKYIHFIAANEKLVSISLHEPEKRVRRVEDELPLLKEEEAKKTTDDVMNKKSEIISLLQKGITKVQNEQNSEKLAAFEKNLKSAISLLDLEIIKEKKIPSVKIAKRKIEHQRKFKSIKRKKKQTQETLKKPTIFEKEEAQNILLS